MAAADEGTAREPVTVRFATFNASLNRDSEGALVTELQDPTSEQPRKIAQIIQLHAPDVLLVNEFDFDAAGEGARLFQENFLGVSQGGSDPITYPHVYVPETNTGVSSGQDLNGDGITGGDLGTRDYGNDAFGFGEFPGKFGMVVFSKYPLEMGGIRTFRNILWRDMVAARSGDTAYASELPKREDGSSFLDDGALGVMRVSSKTHADVPVDVMGRTVHFLISHPTPPGFDGDEDRNGLRNADEIALWVDYIRQDPNGYIVDDAGGAGGLAAGEPYVIAGDLNADPNDGGARVQAIAALISLSQDAQPRAAGGREASALQGGANTRHTGDPELDTADFSDAQVGNLRVDYVLPSRGLGIMGQGIFWPVPDGDAADVLKLESGRDVTDHRLVWVDLEI